ncbi:hypothetical protein O181_040823 [Austropuccinia psidii MF-1]|uniref:MULE transposase domain-containing protein n=1 Tax=Austropuccinia psidii MF-1 TaxID=1389203 RepID=A0A9Q3DG71_9BASI|nr:hypothetical protein [Austropuccinia psidii MF-1]
MQVEGLMKANVHPNQILSQLYAHRNTCTNIRTLYSYKGHLSIKERNGQLQLEYLIRLLKERNWIHSNQIHTNGKITNLFSAHPAFIELDNIKHHVILIDATYWTCKYNFPLFHMVGQTATGQTFSLAFWYMQRENDYRYIWAFQELEMLFQQPRIPKVIITDNEPALKLSIELVFPSSIYNYFTWNISKTLIKNCCKWFQEDDWEDYKKSWSLLVSSKSAEEYDNNLEKIIDKSKDYLGSCAYISKSLLPFKKFFFTFWGRKHPHLGNLASSHVESAHYYIKLFINNSNRELSTVFQSFKTAIDIHLKNIHHTMGKDRVCKLTDASPPFKKLLCTISIKEIKIIEEKFQKLNHQPNLHQCSKKLMNGMGIPSSHEIENLLNTKGYIGSEDFHPQ